MSEIDTLLYGSRSGLWGEWNSDDDPYWGSHVLGTHSGTLFHEGSDRLRWNYRGRKVEAKFAGRIYVCPTPAVDGVVVVVNGDPRYPEPANAIVLNADGSLRHRLPVVKLVSKEAHRRAAEHGDPLESDGYGQVNPLNDSYLLVSVYINQDFLENREYDPVANIVTNKDLGSWRL